MREATIAYIGVNSHLKPKDIEIELGRSFIEACKNQVTMHVALTVDKAMASPYPAALDGDLHAAGRAPQVALPVVGEIVNARGQKAAIDLVHGAEGTGTPLMVSGVWRVWPEHPGRSPEKQGEPLPVFDTANPDHVFEIHPITAIGRLQLRDSFIPVAGFKPGDAQRTFGIYEKAPCALTIKPTTVSIVTETGLYNDVEFVMNLSADRQIVAADGRIVIASARDLSGKLLVERLRMVFARGTPPEVAVRSLRPGGQLHVYGIPRLDFAEISRRVMGSRTNPALLTQNLPYEMIIIGVYPK
jgi:hypothetical protein